MALCQGPLLSQLYLRTLFIFILAAPSRGSGRPSPFEDRQFWISFGSDPGDNLFNNLYFDLKFSWVIIGWLRAPLGALHTTAAKNSTTAEGCD